MGGSIGPLLCTIDTKAEIEAANGLQQLEHIADLVMVRKIKDLRETHILDLHRLAVEGIYPCAGRYRDARVLVGIEGSDHAVAPPLSSQPSSRRQ